MLCDVYRLQQRDASLQGAGMLAAGIKQQKNQQIEKIQLDTINPALMEKYQRWKIWLVGLLGIDVPIAP